MASGARLPVDHGAPGRRAAFATRVGDLAKDWRLEEEDSETHLCVWRAERQRKDDAFQTRQREAFDEALRSLHDRLSKPNHVKRFDKVLERLGRIRERHARVNRQYDFVEEPGEKGQAATVSWCRNDRFARRDAKAGTYVLRTSRKEWSLEAIVCTYWRLGDLEATFRSLKGDVGLRPIRRQRTARIGAHLFIAVLAYHAVHLVRLRLAAQGGRDSWETIRNHLSGWVRLTSTLHGVDGARHVIRQDADPTAAARAVAPRHRRRNRPETRPNEGARRNVGPHKSCDLIDRWRILGPCHATTSAAATPEKR